MTTRIGFSLLLLVSPAFGHGLVLEVIPERGNFSVEVYYPEDGKIARGARITVTDAEARTVAEGTLDARGRFDFAPTEAVALKVVAEVTGHRARTLVEPGVVDRVVARDPGLPAKGQGRSRRVEGGEFPGVRVLAGLALILSVTGLLMAISLQKRVARLESDAH